MPTPVIVNDIIILLILTTRPKEERSNAFNCPPEVRAGNDRLLVSMNHLLARNASLAWHSRSRSQRHHCKISRVSIQSRGKISSRGTTMLLTFIVLERPCIYHSLFPYFIPQLNPIKAPAFRRWMYIYECAPPSKIRTPLAKWSNPVA